MPWTVNEAWAVLDLLKPGVLGIDTRSFLAGLIAAALERAATRQPPRVHFSDHK